MDKLEQVAEIVGGSLGEGYCVQSVESTKNNGTKVNGILVRGSGETTGIAVYVSDECLENDTVSEIADSVQRKYQDAETSPNPLKGIENPVSRELILSNVVYQLVNKQKNAELLKSVPYKEFLDLALIYRVVLSANKGSMTSYVVRNDFLQEIGISMEELEKAAKENTISRLGVTYNKLGDVFDRHSSTGWQRCVLTNKVHVNGAILMAYDSVLSELAAKLNSNLIILPSSVHEVLIVSEDDDSDVEVLRSMVRMVNESDVIVEDFLSNSVYRFVRDTGVVELV